MTVSLAAALLMQVIAIMLLRLRLGRRWLRHPVSVMVLVSVVYQGVTPLLDAVPSIGTRDTFRAGIGQGDIDSATLVMSAGVLGLTIAYLLARPEQTAMQASPDDSRRILGALDWRWLACACIPLGALAYEGRDYNNGGSAVGNGAPLTVQLASEFFMILVVLTAFSFLLRRGQRFFLPVLVAQSLILAATGERNPVIADAITLAVLLAHAGFRLRRRQVMASAALIMVAVLAITGARAQHGRALYTEDNGLVTRVDGLGQGLTSAPEPSSSSPGLLSQAADRLDGTAFAGGILQAIRLGQPRLSPAYVPDSLLIAAPSALWPSKLGHANLLDSVQLETECFGLQNVNFLPTLPGLYLGFLTPPWLIAFLAFLGLLAGRGERALFRSLTPARMVMLAGAVSSAMVYEQGLPGMLVTIRSAVVLAVVVKVTELAPAMRSRGHQASPQSLNCADASPPKPAASQRRLLRGPLPGLPARGTATSSPIRPADPSGGTHA